MSAELYKHLRTRIYNKICSSLFNWVTQYNMYYVQGMYVLCTSFGQNNDEHKFHFITDLRAKDLRILSKDILLLLIYNIFYLFYTKS